MKTRHFRVIGLLGPVGSAIAIGIALSLAGCGGESMELMIRSKINAALEKQAEATRVKDIDSYMASIPKDIVLRDNSGEIMTRGQIRAEVLRDWSMITKTISINEVINSIQANDDSAVVYTSQNWKRLMPEQDGTTVDTVVTSISRREIWRNTPSGWFRYASENIEVKVFVNGYPYP